MALERPSHSDEMSPQTSRPMTALEENPRERFPFSDAKIARETPMKSASNPSILVVDDEEPIRFSLGDYFRTQGFAVDCACELEEAQALLVDKSYSFVIADLRLTSVDAREGLELVRFVRARWPRTGIILLTAHGTRQVEREALRCGVTFVRKPTPLATLGQMVKEHIDGAK